MRMAARAEMARWLFALRLLLREEDTRGDAVTRYVDRCYDYYAADVAAADMLICQR